MSCDLSSLLLDRKWCPLQCAMQHRTGHSGRCQLPCAMQYLTGRLLQDSGYRYGFGQGLRYRREVWAPQGRPKTLVQSHLPRDRLSPNPLRGQPYQESPEHHRWAQLPPGRHWPSKLHLVELLSLQLDSVVLVGSVAYCRLLLGPLLRFVPPFGTVGARLGLACAVGHGRRRPWPRSVEHGTPPRGSGIQSSPLS